MERHTTFTQPLASQSGSPLFTTLPGEVRDRIFAYALRSHDDDAHAYDADT